MKTYPSINNKIIYNKYTYVFDKLDGSNLRFEWSKKKGFHRFGSRRKLIVPKTPILGEAISLFLDTMSEELINRFKDKKYEKVTVFAEYYGDNSFSGQHLDTDDMKLSLIDIAPYKKGILNPDEFLQFTEGIDRAKLLFEGFLSEKDVLSIKSGNLEGMTFEGVICKIKDLKKGPVMFKVKNKEWLDKLFYKCNGNTELFDKLK